MQQPRWDALEWTTEDRFSLDGVQFWLTTTDYTTPSTPAQFVLLKNRAFLDSYRVLFDMVPPERLLEIGFYHGGALAFYDRLLRPRQIVGIDQVWNAPILDHYIGRYDVRSIAQYCGVDQADAGTMVGIMRREFPARDIDVAIDDASHLYAPTRATFEVVFPYVRPGGLYVIEDWAWAHWPGIWQDATQAPIQGVALSNLVFELTMLHASRPDLIASIHIDQFRVAMVRGPAPACEPFRIDDVVLTRGKRLQPI